MASRITSSADLGEADRELSKVDATLTKTRERADHLAERIDDLRSELAKLEADAEKVARDIGRLDGERADAAARVRAAEGEAETARRALPEGRA